MCSAVYTLQSITDKSEKNDFTTSKIFMNYLSIVAASEAAALRPLFGLIGLPLHATESGQRDAQVAAGARRKQAAILLEYLPVLWPRPPYGRRQIWSFVQVDPMLCS
jgi:hypothetical protein